MSEKIEKKIYEIISDGIDLKTIFKVDPKHKEINHEMFLKEIEYQIEEISKGRETFIEYADIKNRLGVKEYANGIFQIKIDILNNIYNYLVSNSIESTEERIHVFDVVNKTIYGKIPFVLFKEEFPCVDKELAYNYYGIVYKLYEYMDINLDTFVMENTKRNNNKEYIGEKKIDAIIELVTFQINMLILQNYCDKKISSKDDVILGSEALKKFNNYVEEKSKIISFIVKKDETVRFKKTNDIIKSSVTDYIRDEVLSLCLRTMDGYQDKNIITQQRVSGIILQSLRLLDKERDIMDYAYIKSNKEESLYVLRIDELMMRSRLISEAKSRVSSELIKEFINAHKEGIKAYLANAQMTKSMSENIDDKLMWKLEFRFNKEGNNIGILEYFRNVTNNNMKEFVMNIEDISKLRASSYGNQLSSQIALSMLDKEREIFLLEKMSDLDKKAVSSKKKI